MCPLPPVGPKLMTEGTGLHTPFLIRIEQEQEQEQEQPVVGAIAPILVDIRSLGRFLVKRGRTGVLVQAQF